MVYGSKPGPTPQTGNLLYFSFIVNPSGGTNGWKSHPQQKEEWRCLASYRRVSCLLFCYG